MSTRPRYRFHWIPNSIAVGICLSSFLLSWIESTVNLDSHHWGLMYLPASDLLHGAIPHKDAFTIYGALTSWAHCLALWLFGEQIRNIGIATGFFYASSLFLSFRIFASILAPRIAVAATFMLFLIHPYIIYPWSNYCSYSFFLAGLLCFIRVGRDSQFIYAGFLVGMSVLCRYSAVVAVVPPFLTFFAYRFHRQPHERPETVTRAAYFCAGALIPVTLFICYLGYHGAANDLLIQNKVMASAWGRDPTEWRFFRRFIYSVVTFKTLTNIPRDSRTAFFSINLVVCLATIGYFWMIRKTSPPGAARKEDILCTISLASLFGYLNSVHLYEVFRLVNGAAIGVGIIGYFVAAVYRTSGVPVRGAIVVGCLCFGLVWCNSLLFVRTASVYNPWKTTQITEEGVRSDLPGFGGKKLTEEYEAFYTGIRQTAERQNASLVDVVNYTWDPLAAHVTGLNRIQRAPVYVREMEEAYPGKADAIRASINSKSALVLARSPKAIPGYEVIAREPWPAEIAWIARYPVPAPESPGTLYILAPFTGLRQSEGFLSSPE